MEGAGLRGLPKAIKDGGYKAFVELPEAQKDALKTLIMDKAGVDKVIRELGSREGLIPKEFADEILEGFVNPKGGSIPRAGEKQDKMWEGAKARRLEEKALGDVQNTESPDQINSWLHEFMMPKGVDGERIKVPMDQLETYQTLAQKELSDVISKDALGKLILYSNKGTMSYKETLDTIRSLDDGIDFTANSDAVNKVLDLRRGLNDSIKNSTREKISSGDLKGFFGDDVDTGKEYTRLRKSLENASQLNADFRKYAGLKGKSRGLSEFEIDQMADKVSSAFGKIISKRGQAGSKLENNTGYKILKDIDKKQGTDFSKKMKVIWELYSNPQIEVTKTKGQNALSGFNLPPRAQVDSWSQAEYFGRGNIPDVTKRAWKRFKSGLIDWSQPRADLGATAQNKMLIDLASGVVGKMPQTMVLNALQDAGVPARQIIQIMRPATQDKSEASRKHASKDTSTKKDKEVTFKSLAEVGIK